MHQITDKIQTRNHCSLPLGTNLRIFNYGVTVGGLLRIKVARALLRSRFLSGVFWNRLGSLWIGPAGRSGKLLLDPG